MLRLSNFLSDQLSSHTKRLIELQTNRKTQDIYTELLAAKNQQNTNKIQQLTLELIASVNPLLLKWANHFAGYIGSDAWQDCYHAGIEAIIKSIGEYDIEHQSQSTWITYAYRKIFGQMRKVSNEYRKFFRTDEILSCAENDYSDQWGNVHFVRPIASNDNPENTTDNIDMQKFLDTSIIQKYDKLMNLTDQLINRSTHPVLELSHVGLPADRISLVRRLRHPCYIGKLSKLAN
jgi:hypothetical protein